MFSFIWWLFPELVKKRLYITENVDCFYMIFLPVDRSVVSFFLIFNIISEVNKGRGFKYVHVCACFEVLSQYFKVQSLHTGIYSHCKWIFLPKSLLTLWALRVIIIKFLLVISLLCETEWSWESRTWSHKMNLLDILSTSPHYFCRKWIGATIENSNFDLRI